MKKTKKILTISIIVFLASFLIYGFLYFGVRAKTKEVESISNEIEINKARLERFLQVENIIKDIEGQVTDLDTLIIGSKEEDLAKFLAYIEEVGESSGISVHIQSILENKEENFSDDEELPIKKLNIVLAVEGVWPKVEKFLKLTEQVPYISSVKKVLLSVKKSESGNLWNGSVEISVAVFNKIKK